MKKKKTKLDEIVDTLKTGDLVLFAGVGVISKIIFKLNKSKWTHVGMIMIHKGKKQILESLKNIMEYNLGDIKGKREGVNLSPLKKRLQNFKYDMKFLFLDQSLTKEQIKNLELFYKKNKWKLWDSTLMFTIFDVRDNKNKGKKKKQKVFCSELVANAYQAIGVMPKVVRSHRVIPADFEFYQTEDVVLNKKNNKVYKFKKYESEKIKRENGNYITYNKIPENMFTKSIIYNQNIISYCKL
jgi:hypothetical protein